MSALSLRFILTVLALSVGQTTFGAYQGFGSLKSYCESDKSIEYFYTKEGSGDVTFFVSYHKRLHKNVIERSLSPQQGNTLLGQFEKSSKLGIGSRCEEVIHYN